MCRRFNPAFRGFPYFPAFVRGACRPFSFLHDVLRGGQSQFRGRFRFVRHTWFSGTVRQTLDSDFPVSVRGSRSPVDSSWGPPLDQRDLLYSLSGRLYFFLAFFQCHVVVGLSGDANQVVFFPNRLPLTFTLTFPVPLSLVFLLPVCHSGSGFFSCVRGSVTLFHS